MAYAGKADGVWLNKTDSGGTATSNLVDKDDANRWEANQLDAHNRLTALEGTPTVNAANPPAGLTAVTFNNTTDDRPALQALLDYVKNTYGGGRVVLSKPNGAGVRINSGITVPTNVQLVSDETTLLNASNFTTGAAITISGQNFSPLVGIRMDGGRFTPTSANLTGTYTGIKISGVGLKLEKCHLQYFDRAYDTAASDTWSVVFEDCTAEHCAIAWYADITAAGAGNAGERNTWRGGAIANNVLGFQASEGGQHLRLESTSLDFNTVAGRILNAHVFMQGVHLEMNSSTGVDYCFEVTVNAIVHVDGMEAVLGSGLYKMFRNDGGSTYAPWNTGFGEALWRGATVFYTNSASASGTVKSRAQSTLPANASTVTLHYPFPLQWSVPTATFVNSGDSIWVSAQSSTAGTITFTASATNASARTFIVDFG